MFNPNSKTLRLTLQKFHMKCQFCCTEEVRQSNFLFPRFQKHPLPRWSKYGRIGRFSNTRFSFRTVPKNCHVGERRVRFAMRELYVIISRWPALGIWSSVQSIRQLSDRRAKDLTHLLKLPNETTISTTLPQQTTLHFFSSVNFLK